MYILVAEIEGTGLVCGPGALLLGGEGERAPELGLCPEPSMDVQEFKLPQITCASYMRREELKTAHKATALCSHFANSRGVFLNTDGTTKQQKKLGGVVANNMVLSVNELSDGTAASSVTDISNEFEKLRKAAHALGLPNPNSINWTLVVSSTSDSASTQKRVNQNLDVLQSKLLMSLKHFVLCT